MRGKLSILDGMIAPCRTMFKIEKKKSEKGMSKKLNSTGTFVQELNLLSEIGAPATA